ncbi:MAG: pyridoxamine 5'-phosphate oxidase family protein [Hyphomicrobiales bacterium]|nr:pyridoxamine 5'-phosphate oxidase family protein [Hyphomicrobiales bacterium]
MTEARNLIRAARIATLATINSEDGYPYASLISVASAMDGSPVFLISELAVHTRNIKNDPRVSILFAADSSRHKDPLNAGRVSLMGAAIATKSAEPRERFLARHPEAALYADFADFSFYAMTISHAHYVGGFGRISSLDATDILVEESQARHWQAEASRTVQIINGKHQDELARIAGDNARAVACDPDGFDISAGNLIERIAFRERISSAEHIADAPRQIETDQDSFD